MARNKLDMTILALAVATFVSGFVLLIIFPVQVSLTSSGGTTDYRKIAFPTVMVSLSMLFIFGYASYWALNIRRGIAVGLYRNQALGVALIGASFGITTFVQYVSLVFTQGNGYVGFMLAGPPIQYVQFLTIFYWLDAFVLASRRSDPDFRNVLGWTRLRKILWGLIAFGVIFDIVGATYEYIYAPQNIGPPLQQGVNLVTLTATVIIILPLFLTVIPGALVLPIIARRSKDLTLRRQLKWFGLFVIFLLLRELVTGVAVAVGVAMPQINGFVIFVILYPIIFVATGIAGYCLYRSARALIPGAEKLPTLAAPKL